MLQVFYCEITWKISRPLQIHLLTFGGDIIDITCSSIKYTFKKGEHYISIIYMFNITFEMIIMFIFPIQM